MLKGRPGSAEFMDHYAELLAQSENAAAHDRRIEDQAGQHRRADRQVSAARHLHQGTGQGDTAMRGVRSSTTFASA